MLTWEEISVAPGAGTMLARLANQVARQNGLDASTVRASACVHGNARPISQAAHVSSTFYASQVGLTIHAACVKQVSVTQMSTDVDLAAGRRLNVKQEIPVTVTYTLGTTA